MQVCRYLGINASNTGYKNRFVSSHLVASCLVWSGLVWSRFVSLPTLSEYITTSPLFTISLRYPVSCPLRRYFGSCDFLCLYSLVTMYVVLASIHTIMVWFIGGVCICIHIWWIGVTELAVLGMVYSWRDER